MSEAECSTEVVESDVHLLKRGVDGVVVVYWLLPAGMRSEREHHCPPEWCTDDVDSTVLHVREVVLDDVTIIATDGVRHGTLYTDDTLQGEGRPTVVTAPRIARNCVGRYLIVGLRLNQTLRRELEAEGWRWARRLPRGGGYFELAAPQAALGRPSRRPETTLQVGPLSGQEWHRLPHLDKLASLPSREDVRGPAGHRRRWLRLLVIAVVGFASAMLLSFVERALVPWKHA